MSIETELTLKYYAEKAQEFSQNTQTANLSDIAVNFLKHIVPGGHILDLGCGAGRDSKTFIDAGYTVTAVDGSEQLCHIATQFIHQEVICASFEDFTTDKQFDGIWACASLLHLNKIELVRLLPKFISMLKDNGYFYLSFKYGDFSGMRNGRFFTDLTQTSFKTLMQEITNITIDDMIITNDVRADRKNEKWLNVYMKKSAPQ